jgi:[protein]-arginine 3-hydroxylase / protease
MPSASALGPKELLGSPDIARLDRPSRAVFERDFLAKHRPCVVRGLMDDWPAMKLWDDAYLRRVVGSVTVPVSVTEGERSVFVDDVKKFAKMSFAEFLDLDHGRANGKRYLMMQRAMEKAFPELAKDVGFPELFDRKKLFQSNFWYAPGENMTTAHFDMAANLLCLVRGEKRFVLSPPGAPLYPHPVIGNFATVELEKPDLARFPKFTRAGALDVTLAAGEMLFIPGPWWHQVYSKPSVAVNMWWWPGPATLLKTFLSPQVFSHCVKRVRQMAARKLTGKRGPTSVYDS